jgi:hypothetical protein
MAATCPCCGYTTPYKNTREQLRAKRGGTNDARMVAVITLDQSGGRYFRLPTDADREAAEIAVNVRNHNARKCLNCLKMFMRICPGFWVEYL